MPRNGSGTYSLPEAAFVPGTTIQSAAVNDDFSDIASALTGSVAADGQTPITGTLKGQVGSAASPAYGFVGDTSTGFYRVGASDIGVTLGGTLTFRFTSSGLINFPGSVPITIPVGAVMDFAGSAAPTGWLLCFGQSLNTTTYAALFAVIGYTYGGSGTSFSLPDYRGRDGVGKDDMGGSAANRVTNAGSGIVGTTLGATGGNQGLGLNGVGLARADLPNVSPTFTGNAPGNVALNSTNILQWDGTGSFNGSTAFSPAGSSPRAATATSPGSFSAIAPNTTIPTPAGTVQSLNGGVTQTVPTAMDPTIIVNKIIFAGA